MQQSVFVCEGGWCAECHDLREITQVGGESARIGGECMRMLEQWGVHITRKDYNFHLFSEDTRGRMRGWGDCTLTPQVCLGGEYIHLSVVIIGEERRGIHLSGMIRGEEGGIHSPPRCDKR